MPWMVALRSINGHERRNQQDGLVTADVGNTLQAGSGLTINALKNASLNTVAGAALDFNQLPNLIGRFESTRTCVQGGDYRGRRRIKKVELVSERQSNSG